MWFVFALNIELLVKYLNYALFPDGQWCKILIKFDQM